jgi:predicted metal-binding membrane protein
MALLFVGGVMNVLWIAAIAILVLAEKVVPAGRVISRTAGAGLVMAGSGPESGRNAPRAQSRRPDFY